MANRKGMLVLPLCTLLLALILPIDARTEEASSSVTDLKGYLSRAQVANPDLMAFKARYEAAMQRIPQATALPDPMLQVTHFVESVQTRTGPQENIFMVSQRLPWFGKLQSRADAASAEAEALWFAFQNRQLALARTVSIAFFDYGFTGRAITLTRQNLQWLTELEPIIEEKVRGGGEINPLLRLKVEAGKVTDNLASLQQKRVAQSARLAGLLAVPGDHLFPWPTLNLPPTDLPEAATLLDAVANNNPELKRIKRKMHSAEARVKNARLAGYPDVTLGFNYIQVGDPEVNPSTPDAGTDPWGVTASLNIPLWTGKNRSAQAEAIAGKRALGHEYANKMNTLQAELLASLALLKDANRRLQLYGEELLDLAEQAAENSRASYESGRTGILEVIDSERSLLDLQLLSWLAAADAWKQRVIIQTLTNQPIHGITLVEGKDE